MGSNLYVTSISDIALEMGDAPFGSNLKNSDYTDFDMRFDFIAFVGNKVHEHIKNAWDY